MKPEDAKYYKPIPDAERTAGSLHRDGSARKKIVESAHSLAMLALQSERYSADHEYRDAVDAVLLWSLPAWTAQCQAPNVRMSDGGHQTTEPK